MARIETVRIKRWREFVELVEFEKRFENWAFRGQANAAWPLLTKLSRQILLTGVHQRAWADQEARTLRIFKRKAHLYLEEVPAEHDDFQWLALMQHHGAPTRLLDFTWSPYVAAFFALEAATTDAAIWAISPREIALIHQKHPELGVDLNKVNPLERGNFTRHFLHGKKRFVWQGEPFVMNRRLIAQSGTFLMPSVVSSSIEELLVAYPQHKTLAARVVLETARVRGDAMRSLYTMNISHATLFPDLDGLARSMGFEFEYNWLFDPRTRKPAPG
jgi:hypothetical protein